MKFTILIISAIIAISHASLVRVAHASPDAPAVDVYVDGFQVWNFVDFREVTFYAPVREGNRNIRVNVAGTTTTVINANVTLERRKPYTVAAIS